MSTELETNIVSVERIREYMYVPTEAAPKKEDLYFYSIDYVIFLKTISANRHNIGLKRA